MIELTADAQKCLDAYLGEMRASLAGCPSVDSSDVERDVMEHIDNSLSEAPTPVDSPALHDVLEQLGSPSQWIPEEELSWRRWLRLGTRRLLKRLWSGPEDFRLAYLSIGLLAMAGLLFLADSHSPLTLICVGVSFVFARAALSADADHQRLGAQRWLLYPVLILIYLPLVAALLLWVIVPAVNLADELQEELESLSQLSRPMLTAHLAVTCTAVWWLIVGVLLWGWPGLVQNTFYPFANGFRRRHALILAAVGLLVFVGALVLDNGVLAGVWRALPGDWFG